MAISKTNNFDMIRLLAALQVLVTHGMEHMKFQSSGIKLLVSVLNYIPGVPIFFTVSGFLIYASFDNNHDLKKYFRSRFLRIFPGLWLCLLFTIGLLIYFGFVNIHNAISKPFLAWLLSQVSFFQFYTPDMLRAIGVHNPNGSLWTIPIEISFYIAIPVIFYLIKSLKIKRNYLLILLSILSVVYNYWYGAHYKHDTNQTILVKLMGLNLVPYLFYFLLGSLAYVNWHHIKKYYEGKGLIWLGIYVAYCLIFSGWMHQFSPSYWVSFYGLIAVIILSQTILSLAYTAIHASKTILKGNDISYGVYLYHMPVINTLIMFGYKYNNLSLLWIFLATVLLALLSWKVVEKPMLALKRNKLN